VSSFSNSVVRWRAKRPMTSGERPVEDGVKRRFQLCSPAATLRRSPSESRHCVIDVVPDIGISESNRRIRYSIQSAVLCTNLRALDAGHFLHVACFLFRYLNYWQWIFGSSFSGATVHTKERHTSTTTDAILELTTVVTSSHDCG